MATATGAAFAVGDALDADHRSNLGLAKNGHETPQLPKPAKPGGGRPANLRPFRDGHEKVPIRVGPFDSPDRHPNRMVETTTSCRLTPYCAGSPSVAATHFRIHASRRRSVRGRQAMPAPRSKPNQSPRSGMLRGPSDRRSSRPDGAASPPNGEDVAWKERRQPSPRVEKHPEPTRTFQERGDQGGRQTSRYRRISPAGRTHPPIQVMGHLKPAEQGLNTTKASENLMPATRETTPRDLALNRLPVALESQPGASSPLHLVVATRKVPHFGILSRIEWNRSRKRIPRPEEFSSTPSGCGRMSTGRRPTTGCGQTVETC